jgi:hypothetical protein
LESCIAQRTASTERREEGEAILELVGLEDIEGLIVITYNTRGES